MRLVGWTCQFCGVAFANMSNHDLVTLKLQMGGPLWARFLVGYNNSRLHLVIAEIYGVANVMVDVGNQNYGIIIGIVSPHHAQK